MKPISEDKVRKTVARFRHPLPEDERRMEIRCFGNFDVPIDGAPVAFKYKKTKEMLAYLTDRNGAEVTTREIMAAIFEDDKPSYFGNVRLDLLNVLQSYGIPDVVFVKYGRMRIVRERVKCDYFDYLDGKNSAFYGEYMSQYSFAEETWGLLNNRK